MAAGKIGYPFTINQENTFMVCKESVFVSHVEKREHAKVKSGTTKYDYGAKRYRI